jgi:hypothetical protein
METLIEIQNSTKKEASGNIQFLMNIQQPTEINNLFETMKGYLIPTKEDTIILLKNVSVPIGTKLKYLDLCENIAEVERFFILVEIISNFDQFDSLIVERAIGIAGTLSPSKIISSILLNIYINDHTNKFRTSILISFQTHIVENSKFLYDKTLNSYQLHLLSKIKKETL